MSFDARRWVEANQPPVFVDLDGATFTGRLWSHVEYLKGMRAFIDLAVVKGDASAFEEYETKLRELIASMGFSKDAADRMLKLPDGAFEGLMKSFFDCQRAGRIRAPSTTEPHSPLNPAAPTPTTPPASESPAS